MSEFGANNHSGEHPNESKYEDRTVRIESGFAEKLSDFWFHHRGKVIIGVIILLIAILTVSQMIGKRNNDVMVLYSGSAYLSGEQQNDIQNLLTSLCQSALGNKKFLAGLTQYQVYSKEQIESLRAETFADGSHQFVNSEYNTENYENLYNYIMTGDTAILMLEPWLFHELRKNERLVPMSELFSSVPPSVEAYGYGITLGDTAVYDAYGILQLLPENTVLCFLKPYVFGNTGKESKYTQMKEVFRGIVNYTSEASSVTE
jgi:hypothetical protein